MKILYITAGASGMYCGSCLRDNALGAELLAQGHQVTLLPLYTPTLTDETNVSQHRIFFGGISVYLQQHLPLFRSTPRWLDRVWDSPAVLKLAARRSIPVDPRLLGELTISMLKGEEGALHKEFSKLLDWLKSEPPPDIVDLQSSLFIALARPLREALRIPVCCTLQGEDRFLDGLLEPYRSQAMGLLRANLDSVDAFIAVCEFYADFMAGYLGIPRQRVQVVPLGINLRGYEPAARSRSGRFTIGYFSRVAPEKGLHVLCEAYRRLRGGEGFPQACLEAAGYLAPEHRAYLSEIEQRMKQWGLGEEFHYRGVLDRQEKVRFLQSLDVLSVPCGYAESKGMFVLEALAAGTPVVEPRRGAFPEMIQKTSGGILVEPDDPDSLAEALLSLAQNPARREQLARQGLEGVRRHYTVARMAEHALGVYDGVLNRALTGPRASAGR